MARHVLTDLDTVIASGVEVPRWGVSVAEAQYIAGSVAKFQLHQESRGYEYWEACAQRDHAGCMNIMANARLTGVDGQKVDVEQALDYHARVFQTGIRFRCAGSFSARSVARIIYFTGVRRTSDNELDWVLRAQRLIDELEAHEHQRDQCQWYGAAIEEFLYRVARGTKDNAILLRAMELPGTTQTRKAILEYVSGTIDDSSFQAAIAGTNNSDYCSVYFYAAWYAELAKNHSMGKQYFQALSAPDHNCAAEIFYANRKFHFSAGDPAGVVVGQRR